MTSRHAMWFNRRMTTTSFAHQPRTHTDASQLRERYEGWLTRHPEIPLTQGGEYSADLIEQWADATGMTGVDVEALLAHYAEIW